MSKNKSIKISKITLTIGHKQIELTPEQVRDLKTALDGMYPEATKVIHHYDWWRYPSWPLTTYTYSLSNALNLSSPAPRIDLDSGNNCESFFKINDDICISLHREQE